VIGAVSLQNTAAHRRITRPIAYHIYK
jgi:hypothetical protein